MDILYSRSEQASTFTKIINMAQAQVDINNLWSALVECFSRDFATVFPEEINSLQKYKKFLEELKNAHQYHEFLHNWIFVRNSDSSTSPSPRKLISIVRLLTDHLIIQHPEKAEKFGRVKQYFCSTLGYIEYLAGEK